MIPIINRVFAMRSYQKSSIIVFLCYVFFSLLSQPSFAEPKINGIAVHQELGQSVFIGALFSELLSDDAGALLRNQSPMRMELKIVAPEGISARRFGRLWIEGLAVNNSSDTLLAQAENTVKFDALFKGRLLQGDHLVLASIPGKGVDVWLNQSLLGNISSNQFFSMLLSTWIGNVPLSSDFRAQLLKIGDIDSSLRAQFDDIAPSVNRIAEIREANQSSSEVSSIAASSRVSSSQRSIAAIPIDRPVITPQPLPAPVVVASSSSAAPIMEDEDDEPVLTAQTLLARQFYVNDAIREIRKKTRYPQRALSRNQEGSVRVAVVINRSGNILSARLIESSSSDVLNREAIAAVERAAPFPSLPDSITGEQFEFSVPIRWTLPE